MWFGGRMVFGFAVVAIGVILLLNNFGVIAVDIGYLFSTYWPLFLIAWGLEPLLDGLRRRDAGGKAGNAGNLIRDGIILILIGCLFLGRNLGYFYFSWSSVWRFFWPLILILIGWSLIRGSAAGGEGHWAFWSSLERKQRGWKLEDGSYVALMGGADLDLTTAEIPDRPVRLYLTAVMGGIDVIVPEGLALECQGTAILGGCTFLKQDGAGVFANTSAKREGTPGSQKRVLITATAVLGGVDVKQG